MLGYPSRQLPDLDSEREAIHLPFPWATHHSNSQSIATSMPVHARFLAQVDERFAPASHPSHPNQFRICYGVASLEQGLIHITPQVHPLCVFTQALNRAQGSSRCWMGMRRTHGRDPEGGSMGGEWLTENLLQENSRR